MKILSTYEKASGKQINRSKTAIFFSKSTKEEAKESIKDALGVREVKHYEKYLGFPSLVGKGKKASFSYIKERV